MPPAAAAPARFVIMLDHHLEGPRDDWPVVFVRDTPAELLALEDYSRVWRWLPREDWRARATPHGVELAHRPTGEEHAGRIYALRYVGTDG